MKIIYKKENYKIIELNDPKKIYILEYPNNTYEVYSKFRYAKWKLKKELKKN